MIPLLARATVRRGGYRGFRLGAASVRSVSKVYSSADEAVDAMKSGDTLLAGGFGLCGLPNTLIKALAKRKDIGNLTAVSNNAGAGGRQAGLGILLESGQLSKIILSYIGTWVFMARISSRDRPS